MASGPWRCLHHPTWGICLQHWGAKIRPKYWPLHLLLSPGIEKWL